MTKTESHLQIGVISDTHGLLRPAAKSLLEGVDHILHAGDVGDDGILDLLSAIAPLTAIRGNVDTSGRCALLPATEMLKLGGTVIYLIHSLTDLDIQPAAAGVDLVVSGHSHKASLEQKGGVTYLNPGSVGPRRFKLPVTMAFVHLGTKGMKAELVEVPD